MGREHASFLPGLAMQLELVMLSEEAELGGGWVLNCIMSAELQNAVLLHQY